jgi:hypothetical protein
MTFSGSWIQTDPLPRLGKPLVDELLIEIPALQECVLDAAVVEGVEDVGDVSAVDVVLAGVDDEVARMALWAYSLDGVWLGCRLPWSMMSGSTGTVRWSHIQNGPNGSLRQGPG